jgi:hypothetical protein
MTGTDAAPPRCVALTGEIGLKVACAKARKQHGLPPIS